jgi:hypothetical protein
MTVDLRLLGEAVLVEWRRRESALTADHDPATITRQRSARGPRRGGTERRRGRNPAERGVHGRKRRTRTAATSGVRELKDD